MKVGRYNIILNDLNEPDLIVNDKVFEDLEMDIISIDKYLVYKILNNKASRFRVWDSNML